MTDENYTGVTTGTVATACSLAALDCILESQDIACVKVKTPKKTLDYPEIGRASCRERV